MLTVILDSDFLSSFLKIERCELIRAFYKVDRAIIPAAVHREVAQTDLLSRLLETSWIQSLPTEPSPDDALLDDPDFQSLGSGEQACIVLACAVDDVVLLMSDNAARHFAQSQKIVVVNIPAFLLACKMGGLLPPDQMAQIVQDLKAKDYYEFKADVRHLLLA
jgi:predicted nucleic acid-binding protein